MAYGGIMFYNLHMPLYILGTFTEYPYLVLKGQSHRYCLKALPQSNLRLQILG